MQSQLCAAEVVRHVRAGPVGEIRSPAGNQQASQRACWGQAEMRRRLDAVRRVPTSWKKSFAVLTSHARPLAMSAQVRPCFAISRSRAGRKGLLHILVLCPPPHVTPFRCFTTLGLERLQVLCSRYDLSVACIVIDEEWNFRYRYRGDDGFLVGAAAILLLSVCGDEVGLMQVMRAISFDQDDILTDEDYGEEDYDLEGMDDE